MTTDCTCSFSFFYRFISYHTCSLMSAIRARSPWLYSHPEYPVVLKITFKLSRGKRILSPVRIPIFVCWKYTQQAEYSRPSTYSADAFVHHDLGWMHYRSSCVHTYTFPCHRTNSRRQYDVTVFSQLSTSDTYVSLPYDQFTTIYLNIVDNRSHDKDFCEQRRRACKFAHVGYQA